MTHHDMKDHQAQQPVRMEDPVPYWLNTATDVFEFCTGLSNRQLADLVMNAPDGHILPTLDRHSVKLYGMRLRDADGREIIEWHQRDDYCLRALELLCDRRCWVPHFRFRGNWKIVIEVQQGEKPVRPAFAATLGDACLMMLRQVSDFWA